MKLIVANSIDNKKSIECTLCHDIHGNLYFEYSGKYFVMLIGVNDDLEWIEINDYNLLIQTENKLKYSEIKNVFEKNSLRGKAVKELEDSNYNEEEDEIDNAGHFMTKYKSYPEDKLYVEDDNNKNEDDAENNEIYDDSNENCTYKFSKFGEESVIKCLDRTFNVSASYDTFVMNENTSYVLATLQSPEKSCYRVSVFTSGKFVLNVVGSIIKSFDVVYVDQESQIEFKSVLVKTNVVM